MNGFGKTEAGKDCRAFNSAKADGDRSVFVLRNANLH